MDTVAARLYGTCVRNWVLNKGNFEKPRADGAEIQDCSHHTLNEPKESIPLSTPYCSYHPIIHQFPVERMRLSTALIFASLGMTDAFAFMAPAVTTISRSTRRFAEEGESEPADAADNNEDEPTPAGSEENSATDILNSPAFLKRKLEVLQSDIAQVDADTEEARAQLEAGKAEWGPQLDELQKEVSSGIVREWFFCFSVQID